MSEAMKRVLDYFEDFCRRIEQYKEKKTDPVAGKDRRLDAYEALYRLTERINKELPSLKKQERGICYEIRNNEFLAGLGRLRTIAAHVTNDTCKETGVKLYSPLGRLLNVPVETSANAMFSRNVFTVSNKHGAEENSIDHLKYLETARDRIKKIVGKLQQDS